MIPFRFLNIARKKRLLEYMGLASGEYFSHFVLLNVEAALVRTE